MKYQLIGIDIDGTLLDSQGEISPANREAIALAQQRGFVVTLITARRLHATLPLTQALGLKVPIACYNGALIIHSETLKTYYLATLHCEVARPILQQLKELGLPAIAYRHSLQPPDMYLESLSFDRSDMGRYLFSLRSHMAIQEELAQTLDWDPLRIMTYGSNRQMVTLYEHHPHLFTQKHVRTIITPDDDYDIAYLEVYEQTAQKALALQWVCHHFGVHIEQSVAIGDHINDLDMIQIAGLGVAMGNAIPKIKEAAQWQTGCRDDDGVAQAIHRVMEEI